MQKNTQPNTALPIRDGVSPSYLWIPPGQSGPLLPFLASHFTDIKEETWKARLEKNEVVDGFGLVLQAQSPIKRGMCIYYYREIEDEARIPFEERIVFQNERLLVADKPHFLPVIPGGRFLKETLLVRLKNKTGIEALNPIHRLDRETAGLVLFSVGPDTCGKYQALFQQRKVSKTYHALAPHLPDVGFPMRRQSRIVRGEPFFTMKEAAGEPNSDTWIDILERRGENSLYKLMPATGKTHQLRVHLAALGAPILNDGFYPAALPCKGNDFLAPLQLLAKSIAFEDPFTGDFFCFESTRRL